MASDISSIIKSEISSTLESLLSAKSKIEEVILVTPSDLDDVQSIDTAVSFGFSGQNSLVNFYIPSASATQFEYLMLGGVTDLKSNIDDEITDAIKEIVSTISGSMCTSINAQGFDDISDVKSSLGDVRVVSLTSITSNNKLYKFIVKLNDDNLEIFISFDSAISPYVVKLTAEKEANANGSTNPHDDKSSSLISSLLGEESVDNLRLLFDIKMRLSVRLGTKICLLRDVISWDIGEIIELSQMTSEPLDILVNGIVIGSGEAIIVDGKFGVKIKSIGKIK